MFTRRTDFPLTCPWLAGKKSWKKMEGIRLNLPKEALVGMEGEPLLPQPDSQRHAEVHLEVEVR